MAMGDRCARELANFAAAATACRIAAEAKAANDLDAFIAIRSLSCLPIRQISRTTGLRFAPVERGGQVALAKRWCGRIVPGL
jgi:hypothetical protein